MYFWKKSILIFQNIWNNLKKMVPCLPNMKNQHQHTTASNIVTVLPSAYSVSVIVSLRWPPCCSNFDSISFKVHKDFISRKLYQSLWTKCPRNTDTLICWASDDIQNYWAAKYHGAYHIKSYHDHFSNVQWFLYMTVWPSSSTDRLTDSQKNMSDRPITRLTNQ